MPHGPRRKPDPATDRRRRRKLLPRTGRSVRLLGVMAKPTILAVDDDPGASRAIARDLSTRYGADYTIVRATSGAKR